jgi:hypothetical protein
MNVHQISETAATVESTERQLAPALVDIDSFASRLKEAASNLSNAFIPIAKNSVSADAYVAAIITERRIDVLAELIEREVSWFREFVKQAPLTPN